MQPFMPVLSGYPRGYTPDMPGRDLASLYRTNLYRLWSGSHGIDAFIDVMKRDYETAIVQETDARLRLKGERVSNQDVWLAGHWAKRIKESDFDDRWDRPKDPIHMMFESQTMHEGDRHLAALFPHRQRFCHHRVTDRVTVIPPLHRLPKL